MGILGELRWNFNWMRMPKNAMGISCHREAPSYYPSRSEMPTCDSLLLSLIATLK